MDTTMAVLYIFVLQQKRISLKMLIIHNLVHDVEALICKNVQWRN